MRCDTCDRLRRTPALPREGVRDGLYALAGFVAGMLLTAHVIGWLVGA